MNNNIAVDLEVIKSWLNGREKKLPCEEIARVCAALTRAREILGIK